LAPFRPELFDKGSQPGCAKCEKLEEENGAKNEDERRRRRGISLVRPRICLYEDDHYIDMDAISNVQAADYRMKVGAVIVVGTALKVPGAKRFTQNICRIARNCGGFTAWINLKPPPKDLDCLDLAIKGDCETVAKHVSIWWLMGPDVLSDFHIQELQKKWRMLIIGRSPEAVLERVFPTIDGTSLSKILQQEENRARVLGIKKDGQPVFVLAEGSRRSGIYTNGANGHSTEAASGDAFTAPPPPQSSDTFPKLLDCWETEMLKRLSEVEVEVQEIKTQGVVVQVHTSSSVITTVTDLGYEAKPKESLWRLKPGEYLNDEVMNAYLELLPGFNATAGHSIQRTFILDMKPHQPMKVLRRLIRTNTYSIYIPVNKDLHWTFATITKTKDTPVSWTYYDSLGGEPLPKLLAWIHRVFPGIKEMTATPMPKQGNFVDCGLFVLLGIRLLSAGRRYSQAQSDDIIPKFRQRVLAELLACTLDPTRSQLDEFKDCEALASRIPNPSDEVGAKSMSGARRGPSHQRVLPCSVIEIFDSSDSPGESEEEIAQMNPPKGKVSQQKKKENPEQVAARFGEEALIINVLREAVAIERASQKGAGNSKMENIQLSDLWFMISTEKRALKQRHVHYEFSRQFWAEVARLSSRPHQRRQVPKAVIPKLMSKLEINGTSWKYVLRRARRGSVWIELADIFKNDLEDPSVVLSAISDATYTLEAMTLTNRKALFDTIRSRIEEPGNEILQRLKTASALYTAVIHNSLPGDLPIESGDEHLPFKDKVSCGR
jgi:hypothetical protein